MEPEPDLFKILGESGLMDDSVELPAPAPGPLGTRLREFLIACYGNPTGRRARPTPNVLPVFIDDRDAGDVYPAFCHITVRVPDNNDGLFLLQLIHPPRNEEVEALVKAKDGRIERGADDQSWFPVTFCIPVRPKDGRFLRKLARAIRRVTGRGQSYADRNWKWLAPRTADSLAKLARHLDDFRNSIKKARGRPRG
jgi:hypothetical protein